MPAKTLASHMKKKHPDATVRHANNGCVIMFVHRGEMIDHCLRRHPNTKIPRK
ncbi:hypothetical protein RHMOL_Rhmol03G0216700 [Rhododendron molle]|uniref:Uncharacterized protein n=1 Tax=Rhododendron molle TaxID=49168 RepID=A0ACC0PID1_RHOML|nr:hypothetical protein RHMOL_Rhmol03G0216700 [Rhododendron molle]